jgi:hypothetical protein
MLLELTWASFATRAVLARRLLRVIRSRLFQGLPGAGGALLSVRNGRRRARGLNPLRARGYQLSGQSAVHLCALLSSLSAGPVLQFERYLFVSPEVAYQRLEHGTFVFAAGERLPAPEAMQIRYPDGRLAYSVITK